MGDTSETPRPYPFAPGSRSSGILFHATSLPSRYGIGDLGPSAFAWVDRLAGAGQSWWQALPLGPTGYGNSPYQPLSSFAGNVLLISPDQLAADGLLGGSDLDGGSFPAGAVDYPAGHPVQAPSARAGVGQFPGGARPGPGAGLPSVLRRSSSLARRLRAVPGLEGPA